MTNKEIKELNCGEGYCQYCGTPLGSDLYVHEEHEKSCCKKPKTNKEIREKYYIPDYNGIANDYTFEQVEQIQEATRTDERERVIREIEKRVKGFIYNNTTDNYEKAINRHYRNVLGILKLLREVK